MNATLLRFGFPTHPADSYRYFTGKGTKGLVNRMLPENYRDDRTVNKCITAAKTEYHKHWSDNTKPYPGIPELLSHLEKLSVPKAVLSNKLDEFTQLMVKKLLPDFSFQIVRGAIDSVPLKPDPTAALQIAHELKVSPDRFLYLGDTNTDMWTADAAGMYGVGVLWGFRGKDELIQSGAKTIIQSPHELLSLLDNDQM